MRRQFTARTVFAAVVVAATLVGLPAPAGAAQKDDNLSWSVQPSGPNGPGDRSEFGFTLGAGETHTDTVSITNRSAEEKVFRVYSTDAFTASDGGFALLTGAQAPQGVGSWIGLAPIGYTIPPNTRLDIPFTVSVPANASPGDHAGGIVASLSTTTTNADGQTVTIDQRVGARVYVRVAGPASPSVQVSVANAIYANPLFPFGGGPVSVTYSIRNTGNLRVGGTTTVDIKGLGFIGLVSAESLPVKEILPGSEVTITRTVAGVFPAGLLTAEVSLAPRTADGPLPVTSGSASVWGVPWLLLLVIALGAGGGLLFWRRRRGRAPIGSSGPATPTSPEPAAEPEPVSSST